jgi:hypothetical protein
VTGLQFALVWIGLALAALCHVQDRPQACALRLNHSGVTECHVGAYTGPLPAEFMAVDTSSTIDL